MKILIIRLSAMGDVALSVPVLKALSEQYADEQIYFLTRSTFNPFFKDIKNLQIINPDLKGKHKGIFGLFKLYKYINNNYKPDIIIDIHNVLRTKSLKMFFKLSSIKTYKINKGRKEKKQLISKNKKVLEQLKHTSQRYVETFLKAGIKIELNNNIPASKIETNPEIEHFFQNSSKKIGIAPFAMHLQKQYPIDKMKEVIYILEKKGYEIFIFGGGNNEKKIAEEIDYNSKNIHSVIGKYSLENEIALISNLDLMLTMDSANMHIAALTGIKIVSVWGATHPFAGFTPFIPKDKSYIIQNEKLDCRPCSVYGKKKCFKGNLECLTSILPEKIVNVCDSALK